MAPLSLSGRLVVATDLRPLAGVPIRLVGPAAALAGLPGAKPYTAGGTVRWTRQLTGFAGSRWDAWTKEVQGKVPGITWEQFRDEALLRNPQLNADGRLFRTYKAYLLPQPGTAPQAAVEARTGADGSYRFELGQPATYELQVNVFGYSRVLLPVVVNGAVAQPLLLTPQVSDGPRPAAGMRSARADYAALPAKQRRLIDMALALLGDDQQVFDALPPQLRKLCYGSAFLSDPNHQRFKDFACADVVSIALTAAGCDIAWPSAANPHMADYYHPDRANLKLAEITDGRDWQPGDILVYGTGAATSRAGHVNLYVGAFTGVDRSGRTYLLSEGMDVVEGSLEFVSNGRLMGTGIIGCNLQRCLEAKRGAYSWVRHVRLRELGRN